MLKRKSGSIFFTGATAGVKGFANSSAFAMGKFALRGLAQSLARELHPQNIHIGHFVIDGAIGREPFGDYQTMHPDEIAKSYLSFYDQEKSAWAWEIELRTSVEKF
jgi:short-subunit dehydrogenase